jgi:hypothetical protein
VAIVSRRFTSDCCTANLIASVRSLFARRSSSIFWRATAVSASSFERRS